MGLIANLFKKNRKNGQENRILRANDPEFNASFKHSDNYISTSKYSILTFFPLNLMLQMTRTANIYFLVLVILQFIPAVSSLDPASTLLPLVVVILFSMAKDAIDDIRRYLSDNKVNNRKTQVLRNAELKEISWSKVVVGDIIKLESDQFVTADLLLLSTSLESSLCYVETSELDGETNLKVKEALQETTNMRDDLSQLSRFNGELTCESPNNVLSKFEGTLRYNEKSTSINNDKILLRGCKVRNTEWCFGLVVFAGKDTKLMMNSGPSKIKRTNIEHLMNTLVLGIIILLIFMCLICCIGGGFWEYNFGTNFQIFLPWESYVPGSILNGDTSSKIAGSTVITVLVFFSYLIVLNTLVPISLYVSVEIIRFIQSFWINWDRAMYHAESNTAARSRTTTLTEELGQIEYIFSDKTGTLTQNVMTFNKCSINGVSYGDYTVKGKPMDITEETPKVDFSANPYSEPSFTFYDKKLLKAVNDKEAEVEEFFRLLALCHTVISNQKEGKLVYEAQSPDENALVGAARNFGFVFKDRSPTTIIIDVLGQEESYEQLCILDFNNVRKRMSIIVRRDGKIRLFCKGADSKIYERLEKNNARMHSITKTHFENFAQDGLRTLCLASKDIEPAYYEDWRKRYEEASCSLKDRDDKISEVYEEIEKDLHLVGATGIEDKLQDGVPEAIANLMLADIKMWVLTGDKPDTAINIGYSCHLLTEEMGSNLHVIEEDNRTAELSIEERKEVVKEKLLTAYIAINETLIGYKKRHLGVANQAFTQSEENLANNSTRFSNASYQNASFDLNNTRTSHNSTFNGNAFDVSSGKPPEFGLVIDGNSLVFALEPGDLSMLFLETGCLCKTVICCRVTPLQKALVVDLVKKNKKSITLSIGDGANDVSMIKRAHIGIGISGQEGMQAVLSSDYSIAQFRFLERLLLVHGRWSYLRMCKFLKYFFYKNFSFTLCHFWFAFFNGFSAQTLFESLFISVYNIIFTSLPVIMMGVFEQDVSDKMSLQYPKLYTPGHLNYFFNKKVFAQSLLEGFLTSIMLFFLIYGAYHDTVDTSGYDICDIYSFGVAVSAALILVVTMRCCLETYFWTPFNIAAFIISVVCYFLYEIIIHIAFKWSYYGTDLMLWKTGTYWFSVLLTCVVVLITVISEKYYFIDTRPTLVDKLRQQASRGLKFRKGRPRVLRRASTMRKSTRSVGRSGYAFSHQEGFGDLITSGNLMRSIAESGDNLVGYRPMGSFRNRGTLKNIVEKDEETTCSPMNNIAAKNNTTPQNKNMMNPFNQVTQAENQPKSRLSNDQVSQQRLNQRQQELADKRLFHEVLSQPRAES